MAFEWSDFLTLADKLRVGTTTAEHRSAVSRAYYAAFHIARRHVEVNDPDLKLPQDGKAHEVVWTEMQKHDAKISTDGTRLRIARNSADYRPDRAVKDWRKEADLMVLLARSVLNQLKPPPAPPPVAPATTP